MDATKSRACALGAIRAVKQQAVGVFVLMAAIAAFEIHEHFWPGAVFAAVVLGLAWRFQYRVARSARAALASGELEAFAAEQRRSHASRGRVFVWGAPFFMALGWVGFFANRHHTLLQVTAQIATTAFLTFFWFWWRRTLRSLKPSSG